MRQFFFILIMLLHGVALSCGPIVLTDSTLGESFAKSAVILEDEEHVLSIDDVLNNHSLKFNNCNRDVEKIDFTASTFWLKFEVINQSSHEELLIELARAITDKVTLFECEDNRVIKVFFGGDMIQFENRTTNSINNCFTLNIPKNSKKNYVLRLQSDGDNIRIPIIINKASNFHNVEKEKVLLVGCYYGLLVFVAFLYLFYYFGMRDKSFLYYSIYVISIFMFQFSLEGYSFYYVFRYFMILQPYVVVFFAVFTCFSFLVYVKKFLRINRKYKALNRLYQFAYYLLLGNLVLNFFPGQGHILSYPIANLSTLLTLFLIISSIVYLKKQKQKICNYFIAAVFSVVFGAVCYLLANFNLIESDFVFKYSLKIGSAIEIVLLSLSMSSKLRELQKEKELAQLKSLEILEDKNQLIEEQKINLEFQVKSRTKELEIKQEQIKEKSKEIIDSINYAKHLQEVLIPPLDTIRDMTNGVFVFFKPKDIVSGDFYWVDQKIIEHRNKPNEKLLVFATVDCTGHGVPGAFMSIIGLNIFNQAINEKKIHNIAEALDYLNKEVYNTVNKHKEKYGVVKDGMDLAVFTINKSTLMLEFSGAQNSVYIVRGAKFFELKGDRKPIGFSENLTPFSLQKFQLQPNDMIYASTDGYVDQFGGLLGKKFKRKPFQDLLISIANKPVMVQEQILSEKFSEWKGDLEQIDDICVIGVKV